MSIRQENYPRPQLVRAPESWVNLNGIWNFAFDDNRQGRRQEWYNTFPCHQSIRVPFSYEAPLSGIGDSRFHPCVWYHRTIILDPSDLAGDLLLHFEGCDYICSVWINGRLAGMHQGGYTRFSCDITDLASAGSNDIVVCAEDSMSQHHPRGKQRWKRDSFSCWYVQTTGIWKTVWLEKVPKTYLGNLRLTPCLAEQVLHVEYGLNHVSPDVRIRFIVSFSGTPVSEHVIEHAPSKGKAVLSVRNTDLDEWGVRLWSPDQPNLYDLDITVEDVPSGIVDSVKSYFGMREIRIEKGTVYLNDRPLYQKLVLDQGYWPDGLLTPPSDEALRKDVELTRLLGYNGARKHQKIEDERYYAWCDRLGLLVWCEMPSAYSFDAETVSCLTREWCEAVRQNYNHPSIITWVPLNESWGVPNIKCDGCQQYLSRALYDLTHALDATRLVISNDGWEHTESDLVTIHDYDSDGASIRKKYTQNLEEVLDNSLSPNHYKTVFAGDNRYHGQPLLISEYGGIAFSEDEDGWGYGEKVAGETAFLQRFSDTLEGIRAIPACQGYCYTQLTDVQQEMNGLLREDRTPKAPVDEIRRLNQKD